MTTKQEISKWFDEGIKKGADYMIVACDTFDWEDYPIYCVGNNEARHEYKMHDNQNMQKIMEVYDLAQDKEIQLCESRAMHLPA